MGSSKMKIMAKMIVMAGLLVPASFMQAKVYMQTADNMEIHDDMQKVGQKAGKINFFGNWRVSIIEIDGAFMRVPEQAEGVSLQINNNQISGIAGCNNFMLPYSVTNTQQITISEGASTRKMCHPEEVMRFEDAFLRLLQGTFTVEKNFEGITLVKDNVKVYLVR